jgi:class 3 adenylate cyclase
MRVRICRPCYTVPHQLRRILTASSKHDATPASLWLIQACSHKAAACVAVQVDPLHAQRTFAFALAMLEAAAGVVMPDSGLPVRLRVGIHSG